MSALSRSSFVSLVVSAMAPTAVAVACASEAPSGDDDCGDTQTDVFNCGACGRPCAQGQFCQAGQCACMSPYQACGLSCVILQSDPQNCGTCGNACPPSASFCSNGTCSSSCAQTQCGNLCVDTRNDGLNCGACGSACPTGASCANGTCACPAGTMRCGNACMTSCGSGGAGGSTSTGGSTNAGSSGATATGGAAGSGTGGAGGMMVQKLCATKVTPTAPTITDFESYDGTKPAYGTDSWIFTIGPTAAPAYAGLYALSERTTGETPPADYMLTMAGGVDGSNWAARAVNMTTTEWGGGVGLWMGCIDARTFTGVSFYVRGSTPTGMATLSLAMEDVTVPDATNPAGGGTCDPAPADGCTGPSATFAITSDWTQITLPWATFLPGRGAGGTAVAATGDELTGMSFGAGISYVPNPVDGGMPAYVPEPGSFELAVDNLAFTQ